MTQSGGKRQKQHPCSISGITSSMRQGGQNQRVSRCFGMNLHSKAVNHLIELSCCGGVCWRHQLRLLWSVCQRSRLKSLAASVLSAYVSICEVFVIDLFGASDCDFYLIAWDLHELQVGSVDILRLGGFWDCQAHPWEAPCNALKLTRHPPQPPTLLGLRDCYRQRRNKCLFRTRYLCHFVHYLPRNGQHLL